MDLNIIKDIIDFTHLKQDWDGYGAIPTTIQGAVNTIKFVFKLDKNSIYDCYPNPQGTVCLELMKDDSRVCLEVGDEEFSYYLKQIGSKVKLINNLKISDENINNFINEIQ